MPQPYRTKFEKNGKRCPRNEKQLKRLPECGYFERREFIPQVTPYIPPEPPGPGRKFDPFAPGQTLPRRRPTGIPGIPPTPPGTMPGESGEDTMGLRYPQDTLYPDQDRLTRGGDLDRTILQGHLHRNSAYHGDNVIAERYAELVRAERAGYNRVPDLGQFEMDGGNVGTVERQSRTRLYERTGVSSAGLRRRLVRDSYTPDSNFTGRAGRQHQLDNAFDSTGEFAQSRIPSRLPQPRGTPSFPAQDIEEGIIDPYVGEDRQLLNPTQSRRSTTLRIMEQARARTTQFASNRAAEVRENARTLARNLAESSASVQESIARNYATQFRQGYRGIGAAAAGVTGVDLPEFDVEAQIGRPSVPTAAEQSGFRDGTFDIEQGIADPERGTFTERVTGLRSSRIENIVSEDTPFETLDLDDTHLGRDKTFTERLAGLGDSKVAMGAGAVGTAGIGLGVGYGVGYLMGQGGADPYSTAFVSSATGDVAGRFSAIAAQSLGKVALQRFGIATGEAVTENIAKQLAISGLRGTAEGGLAGLALAPVDIALNSLFTNQLHMNHANAGAAASGITGAAFLGGVGAVSLATAPETLGLSLAVGAVVAGIGTLVSWITGHNQDEEEKKKRQEYQRKVDALNNANNERSVLIALMPSSNYNLNTALVNFRTTYGNDAYSKLGVGDKTWNEFSTNLTSAFTDSPPQPAASQNNPAATGDADTQRMNRLYQNYVAHGVIQRICAGKASCALSGQDPGPLSAGDTKFLNDKAGPVWKSQADLAVNMSVGQANFHHQLMINAQTAIINGWNNNRQIPSDFSEQIQRDAQYDATFMDRFNAAAQADAQRDIIQGYISSRGTMTMDKQPANVRTMALSDPTFQAKYDTYIAGMRSASLNLNVTIPQLIDLQSLGDNPAQQQAKYKEIQFDNAKENVNVVKQAQELMAEEKAITKVGFYDIDSAFLQTDPTKVGEWHPTDAQIIQASRAGMTLQQYVDYLTELQKGDAGDFTKIPTYSDAQLTAMGELDFSHLQDDLQLAGYSRDYYIYDPVHRTYTINPHASTVPDEKLASDYQSKYTPEYLLEARAEYAKMITGLNNSFQQRSDAYNKALYNQLTNDSEAYYQQMAAYNVLLSQQARVDTPLMTLDAAGQYNANAMHFHPLSTTMPGRQLGEDKDKDVTIVDHHGNGIAQQNANLTAKQLAEIANAKKMGYVGDDERILQDYIDTKKAIEASGIRNPTQAQVDTYYQHLKQMKGDPTVPKTSDSKTDAFGVVKPTQTITQGNQTKPAIHTSQNLQKDFRDANPNLNPNTTFTDNQIKTLNQGGQVTASDGQQYASS